MVLGFPQSGVLVQTDLVCRLSRGHMIEPLEIGILHVVFALDQSCVIIHVMIFVLQEMGTW